jgi:hypothetical protein
MVPNRDTTRSQQFTYDQVNRLVTGETTSSYSTSPTNCWREAYLYDNHAAGGASMKSMGRIQTTTLLQNKRPCGRAPRGHRSRS